jgi:asparagine synthase (glutamine-hydrolysing)
VCAQYLPQWITARKKRGFAVNVVDQWFRESVGSSFKTILLDDHSLMYSILRPNPVRQLLAEHKAGTHDHHKLLFSLVVFEQWLRGSGSRQAQPAHASLHPA